MRQIDTASIWIYLSSLSECVFTIARELGADLKLPFLSPVTLSFLCTLCKVHGPCIVTLLN